jgi:hypothetical protein
MEIAMKSIIYRQRAPGLAGDQAFGETKPTPNAITPNGAAAHRSSPLGRGGNGFGQRRPADLTKRTNLGNLNGFNVMAANAAPTLRLSTACAGNRFTRN